MKAIAHAARIFFSFKNTQTIHVSNPSKETNGIDLVFKNKIQYSHNITQLESDYILFHNIKKTRSLRISHGRRRLSIP
jgi:hypothetical protein